MNVLLDSFVFGAANSLHCACMCGPLALAFQGGARGAWAYHIGRALSYTLLGFALATAGRMLGTSAMATPTAYVAFVLAAGLIVLALVGERGALSVPGVGNLLQRAMAKTRDWSAATRAGVLGVCTPLLPCGLLWAAFAGAAVAGTPMAGGAVMGGFALGSLPLLLLAQTQARRLLHRFGPQTLRRLQQATMLLAAGMLIWRGVLALQGESCCHDA
ncbi:MAG: sulfite exporter TauE/SafE family protein [Planctomycetota bacterium]